MTDRERWDRLVHALNVITPPNPPADVTERPGRIPGAGPTYHLRYLLPSGDTFEVFDGWGKNWRRWLGYSFWVRPAAGGLVQRSGRSPRRRDVVRALQAELDRVPAR